MLIPLVMFRNGHIAFIGGIMTDKQIMIDGVNVGKCRYFLKDTEGQDYDTDEFVKGCCEAKGSCIGYEFAGYGLCRGDKDCYYKQLARKTEECEKYKKLAADFKDVNKQLGYKYLTIKDECEELKEKYEEIKEDRYNLNMEMYTLDRYRKALEEIEKVINNILNSCLGRNTVSCRPAHNVCGDLIKILDIIHKIKDGE